MDDNTWVTEPDDEEQPQDEAPQEYHAKAHLVLEGSESADWGMVKDCHGAINLVPDDAEVVGTWNMYGEGTYWVSLTTSLEALTDKAIQLTKEIADKRHVGTAKVKKAPRKTSTTPPAGPSQEEIDNAAEVEATTSRISDLRKLIGR